jgi:hypothetical protein
MSALKVNEGMRDIALDTLATHIRIRPAASEVSLDSLFAKHDSVEQDVRLPFAVRPLLHMGQDSIPLALRDLLANVPVSKTAFVL